MKAIGALSLAERLAALAALAAAVASLVGFVPGLYRDPKVVIPQSHGYDVGNLIAVVVVGLGLAWSAHGDVRGRLAAIGALGCLVYSYVTYAFLIVLNPVTVLYIAVLGFAGWSLATGLVTGVVREAEATLADRLPRRTTGMFLVVIAVLFGANWLRQIAAAVVSGHLPAELAANGWPMNPVYVLDLGFAIPLAVLAGMRLLRHRPGGAWMAISMLVFFPLLSVSILVMALFMAADGQGVDFVMIAMFIAITLVSTALGAVVLGAWPGQSSPTCGALTPIARKPRRRRSTRQGTTTSWSRSR